MVIFPTVAVVALLEPLIAAKNVQPNTLVCKRPPGMRATSGARPRNSRWEISVRKMMSPIQMKIGIAASSQDTALEEMTLVVIVPMRSIPNPITTFRIPTPTNISPAKIHMPEPRNSTTSVSRISDEAKVDIGTETRGVRW